VAAFGEDALGVELYAFDGQCAMAQAHDDGAISVFCRAGGDDEIGGERLFGDDQRVIAGAGERGVQPFEDAFAIMFDAAGFAVHQVAGAHDLAAEGFADGLMAKTYAKNRNFAGHVANERNQNASLGRCARAGREQDAVGLERGNLLDGEFIVAMDLDLGAQFSKILDEVVGKRIVVVENEDHIEV